MRTGKSGEIRDGLRRCIQSGEYGPGDRLPRVGELMSMYGTRSRSAVDRALRDLVAEGVLTVVHGSGIYVRQRRQVVRHSLAQADLFEGMAGTGAEVRVTESRGVAPGSVGEVLGVEPAREVLIRTSRYMVDGTTHHVVASYLPATTSVAGLAAADRATLRIESRMPTRSESADLAIAGGTSVFELWRVLYQDGDPVEVSVAVVPGDRVVLDLDVTKDELS